MAPTPMIFIYHSTSAQCAILRRLCFHIAVTEHCVFAPLSFVTSVLAGGPGEHCPVFEGDTTLVELGVFLYSAAGMKAIATDFGFFSVMRLPF